MKDTRKSDSTKNGVENKKIQKLFVLFILYIYSILLYYIDIYFNIFLYFVSFISVSYICIYNILLT